MRIILDADKVLLRTKRLPDGDDDDYITTFQSNQRQEHPVDSPIRNERYIQEDHSIAEDELSNIFRNIVQKRDVHVKEDLNKLKGFFNDIAKRELNKRSNIETRSTHENTTTSNLDSTEISTGRLENRRSLDAEAGSGEDETTVGGGEFYLF